MKFFSFFALFLLFLWNGCTFSTKLTDSEKKKLDPNLQKLLLEQEVPANRFRIVTDRNGKLRYSVIIQTDSPEELKQIGVSISSQVGNRVTALLTLEELRQIIKLPSVHFVESSSKSFPK